MAVNISGGQNNCNAKQIAPFSSKPAHPSPIFSSQNVDLKPAVSDVKETKHRGGAQGLGEMGFHTSESRIKPAHTYKSFFY